MWVEVEFTHHRGIKVARGQEHPRGRLHGEIQSVLFSGSQVIQLSPGPHRAFVARLWAARLVGVGEDAIQLAGLERDGRAWVRQHWICRPRPRPPLDAPMRPDPLEKVRERR
jgi:hypothetical protein